VNYPHFSTSKCGLPTSTGGASDRTEVLPDDLVRVDRSVTIPTSPPSIINFINILRVKDYGWVRVLGNGRRKKPDFCRTWL